MKVTLSYYRHMFRAGYYWSRISDRLAGTGLMHSTLLTVSPKHCRDTKRYNESINSLVTMGRYTKARDLIVALKQTR